MFKKLLFLSAFLMLTGVVCSNKELMPPFPNSSVSPPPPVPPLTQQSAEVQTLEPIMVPPSSAEVAVRKAKEKADADYLATMFKDFETNSTTIPMPSADLDVVSSAIAQMRSNLTRQRVKNWSLPVSSLPGAPIVVTNFSTGSFSNTLYIYNFSVDKFKKVGDDITFSEGEGQSGGGPVSSPGFLHTAFVDRKQSLYIFSNENFNKKLVYHAGLNQSLSIIGWSSNSEKLAFLVLEKYDTGPGGEPVYRNERYKVFNILDGAIITIPVGEDITIEKFIDDGRALIGINVGEFPNNRVITTILNLTTMQLDQDWFEQGLGLAETFVNKYFSHAFVNRNFSSVNSKFVYNIGAMGSEDYSEPPPNLVQGGQSLVIYGGINGKRPVILAQGRFVQYQSALISPSGNQVAYIEENPQTMVMNSFWVHDALTGKSVQQRFDNNEVKIVSWLDDAKLLFVLFPVRSGQVVSYKVLDINSGLIKNVWSAVST